MKPHTLQKQDWKIYHALYERLTHCFRRPYGSMYHSVYERALQLTRQRGRDPLAKESPHVLLCGTASSETTRGFVRFVQSRNPGAVIDVLDLNARPLKASRTKLEADESIDTSRITFTQGNALEIPIADGSIDLLETDYFLLFFSPEDKRKVLKEWARILSDDGAITTRELLPDNTYCRMLNAMRRIFAKRFLGIDTYTSTGEEIARLFREAGLEADIVPFACGPFRSHLLKHMIARKSALPNTHS